MGNIYGSEPPSKDTFWKKYAAKVSCKNVKVFTFSRSKVSGAEKQLDTALAIDVCESAGAYKHCPCKCVLILGTGDLDILPAIKKVFLNTKCEIEMWSWKDSVSSL